MPTEYETIRKKLYGHFRFAVAAWMVALPLILLPLLWMHSHGLLPQGKGPMILACPFLAAAFMLGSFYATIEWTLRQARARIVSTNG
ncbi:MAG: hypothetical protein ACK5OB_05955 [Pirellula sp.]